MKKNFITGLVTLLPLTITVVLILFLVNFLTKPFLGITESILAHYDIITNNHPILLAYASKVIILGVLFGFTLILGLLGRWFLEHYLIGLSNLLFHKIPLVNKIYRACQEIVQTLFTPKSTNFQKVVSIPFPGKSSRALGMISRENLPEGSSAQIKDLVTVLVPGTPNPTVGFVLLYKKEDIVRLNMKPEEALKCIVSCGIILNDFSPSTLQLHEEP